MADSTVTVTSKRGRPKSYEKQSGRIADMIAKYGASKTTEILRANKGSLTDLRDKRVFPKGLNISFPTILRIAKDKGITLTVGRRPSTEKTETPSKTVEVDVSQLTTV